MRKLGILYIANLVFRVNVMVAGEDVAVLFNR